jgi:hypothetical protein
MRRCGLNRSWPLETEQMNWIKQISHSAFCGNDRRIFSPTSAGPIAPSRHWRYALQERQSTQFLSLRIDYGKRHSKLNVCYHNPVCYTLPRTDSVSPVIVASFIFNMQGYGRAVRLEARIATARTGESSGRRSGRGAKWFAASCKMIALYLNKIQRKTENVIGMPVSRLPKQDVVGSRSRW